MINDNTAQPHGELTLQTIAMPADTNQNWDIFGGWLVSQMDQAAAITALKFTDGRVVTVAINDMSFLVPVYIGAVVSSYTTVIETKRSSITINVEVWINDEHSPKPVKVTEGEFIFVSIGESGRTRRFNTLDKL